MKFYYHHIGDFNNATRHLTLLERGIYRDMLDLYYDSEKPLMADVSMLCRKLMARTEDERAAVINILGEFFTEAPEGWRNERCDAELVQAKVKIGAAEERRENEKDRQRRHRDRRKTLFDQLREYNDVPSYDTPTEQLQLRLNTHLSRVTNGRRADDAQEHTTDATANNNPQPTTHNPQPTIKDTCADAPSGEAGQGDDRQDGDPSGQDAGKPPKVDPKVAAVFEHWKQVMDSPRSLLDDKRGGLIRKALKTGYTVEQLCSAIDGCRKSPYHMGENDRGTKYNGLDLILRSAEKIDQFIVIGNSPLVPRQPERRQSGRPSINAIGIQPGADDDIFNQLPRELPR